MPNDTTVTVIIRGKHDTGRTTMAYLIKDFLLTEGGYENVSVVQDTPPLPSAQKPDMSERLTRNRRRAVIIKVELDE